MCGCDAATLRRGRCSPEDSHAEKSTLVGCAATEAAVQERQLRLRLNWALRHRRTKLDTLSWRRSNDHERKTRAYEVSGHGEAKAIAASTIPTRKVKHQRKEEKNTLRSAQDQRAKDGTS